MVQPWKKPFRKAKALQFEKKKKELRDILTQAAWCGLLIQRQISQSDCEITSKLIPRAFRGDGNSNGPCVNRSKKDRILVQ